MPKEMDQKRKEHWKEHVSKNPNDYDGKLLFLEDFRNVGDRLILDTQIIRFSTVIFMEQEKLKINEGFGMLGTQCLIFAPNKAYILVGERPFSSSYYPGCTTVPGGMLEVSDLQNEPKKALMREIHEEVPFNLESWFNLIAILHGWNNVSITFLTSSNMEGIADFDSSAQFPGDENEWESGLRWISEEQLIKMPSNKLLDGLIYYRSTIM